MGIIILAITMGIIAITTISLIVNRQVQVLRAEIKQIHSERHNARMQQIALGNY